MAVPQCTSKVHVASHAAQAYGSGQGLLQFRVKG